MKRRGRRTLLLRAAALALMPVAARVPAQGDVKKELMQYQDHPNGGRKCEDCIQFVPGPDPKGPGRCRIVEGEISRSGWCIEYVAKPK